MLVQVKKYDYSQFPQLVSSKNEVLKFKAKLDIYDVSLSGIMVVKKEVDGGVLVSFVNEFGIKYFDAQINSNKAQMLYCVKQLDKKIVTNILLHDLTLLFLPAATKHNLEAIQLGKFEYRFIETESELQVNEFNKNKMLSIILMEKEGGFAISHSSPKMTLSLKPL